MKAAGTEQDHREMSQSRPGKNIVHLSDDQNDQNDINFKNIKNILLLFSVLVVVSSIASSGGRGL